MSGLVLKRFSQFAWGHDNVAPEAWVNPEQIAYVAPRIVMRGHAEAVDGTLLYFQQEAGVLAVREPIGYVVSMLQSGKQGICRDCYEVLPEAWMSLCSACRCQKHDGVDADPEEAVA
jgi:hypothetical protein